MAVRMNILFPEEIATRLKIVAGEGKQSEYVSRAVRRAMVEDDLRALAEYEAEHGGPDMSFYEESAAGDE